MEGSWLNGQRLCEISHEEPAATAASSSRFVDHPRAQVDTDNVGSLVEQPGALRT